MKRWILPAVLLALALGLAGWWWSQALIPSEADRVRSFIKDLAADVSFGPEERGNIAAARRISRLVGRFTPDASIQVDILGAGSVHLSGRSEIQEALWGVGRVARQLEVRFHDIVPKICRRGDNHGASTATAEARGGQRGPGGF
ncbi:MAG: hypothetical protein KIT22_02140 [Verrucomicrobiae bacterium]|nr:hypothetical protein [Verrucomicrobiae bacterium]